MPFGPLDGLTLLRYAHIFRGRSSGGVEQYLASLNRALLERSDLTILQMHLVDPAGAAPSVWEEPCGRGRLVWVPVTMRRVERSLRGFVSRMRIIAADDRGGAERSRGRRVLDAGRRALTNRLGHLRFPVVVLSEPLNGLLAARGVDLLCLHWMSYDLGPIVKTALNRGVPYIVINHFDNRRLLAAQHRKWLAEASAVAGVSSMGVPAWISGGFVNLRDAIDTVAFDPVLANRVERPPGPVVLLPARMVDGKGHFDLLNSVRLLLDRGRRDISIAFAGALESQAFVDRVRSHVSVLDLADRVCFLGELKPHDLRDWYAASDVVVLPSYAEGLGRVLLEAQAMERPVLAYASGGVSDAIVSEQTGYLVPPGDWASLAERLEFLLGHPEARAAMGRAGRAFVSDAYSITALAERHERFYLDALARASVSPGSRFLATTAKEP